LSLDAQAAGHIAGKFTAHGTDDDWHVWPLSGQLAIETTALGYVSAYVGQVDRASGRLDRAVESVTGNAAPPRLDGELKLINATLDAYQINLSLRDLNFTCAAGRRHAAARRRGQLRARRSRPGQRLGALAARPALRRSATGGRICA
jgi:autotransporter translocation and assembly factor TamB